MMTYGNGIMTHLAEAHCLFCDWNVKKKFKNGLVIAFPVRKCEEGNSSGHWLLCEPHCDQTLQKILVLVKDCPSE